MRSHPLRRVLVALATVTACVAVTTASADALFTDPDSASHTLSTAVLEPAAGLVAGHGPCTALAPSVALTWTPTPSTWADGYVVRRALGLAGPYVTVATLSGRTTTSWTDTSVLFSTQYRYTVQATKQAWRSPDATAVTITTRNALCL